MGQPPPQTCEVVGIEVEPLPDLSDFLVELAHLLPIGLFLSLLIANSELFPLHKDFLELLILYDDLIHLCESEQS